MSNLVNIFWSFNGAVAIACDWWRQTPDHFHSIINESAKQLIRLPCLSRRKFDTVNFAVARQLKAESTTQHATVLESLGAEIAPELNGHGLPLSKCEAYNRVYDQPYESR